MRAASTHEVRDLLNRGPFKEILREELPDGTSTLPTRFVLAIKSNADGYIRHRRSPDHLEQFFVHGAQSLQASSSCLILAISSIYRFDGWLCGVTLAYLQSSELLTRRVFIKHPAPAFELDPHECFELLRPLYSLSDAGDLWHKTLHSHLVEYLQLTPTKTDPSLYFARWNGEITGLRGSYFDDLLRVRTPAFRTLSANTHVLFETTGDENTPFTFARFNIAKRTNVPYAIYQLFYMKKIEELEISCTFNKFLSMRMRFALLANTRPDLQFEKSQIAQVTGLRSKDDARALLLRLNSAIRYAHSNPAHLQFPSSNVRTYTLLDMVMSPSTTITTYHLSYAE